MDPLKRSPIGLSGLSVTRMGLGTGQFDGWPSPISLEVGLATVHRAWDIGIRYFDTAPLYGLGAAEECLGQALAGKNSESLVLSTKVGRLVVPRGSTSFERTTGRRVVFDFSRDGTALSLHESRERLRPATIDMVFIHDADVHHDEALDGAYVALSHMRAEGELKAIGVGMNSAEPLARFARERDFDCLLAAFSYNLLNQDALDELLPVAMERNIAVVIAGIFAGGLLLSEVDALYPQTIRDEKLWRRAKGVASVSREFGIPIRAAAIQFPLAHPGVACVLVGADTPNQVVDNMSMMDLDMPAEFWSTLKERGALREDAPTPDSEL